MAQILYVWYLPHQLLILKPWLELFCPHMTGCETQQIMTRQEKCEHAAE